MINAYSLGFLLGKFIAGSICGLIPLVLSVIRKRSLLGVAAMVVCGFLGLIHPIIAVAVSIMSGIVLWIMCKDKK